MAVLESHSRLRANGIVQNVLKRLKRKTGNNSYFIVLSPKLSPHIKLHSKATPSIHIHYKNVAIMWRLLVVVFCGSD